MTSNLGLSRSVQGVRTLFGAAACSCALVDEDGERLRFAAADGAGADDIVGVEMPVSRGIAGWAVMSGQPIAVRDVAADARFARDVAESTHYVPTSILAAPMFDDDGEVVGVLSLLDPSVDEASDWTLAVLGTVATLVAQQVTAARVQSPADGDLAELGRRVLELARDHDGDPGGGGREGGRR